MKKRMRRHENFSLKEEYLHAWNYVKDSREYVYFAILVFAIFGVLGFFFYSEINSFFNLLGFDLNANILGYLESILELTEGMGFSEITGFIFLNNLQSSFSGMVGGIVFSIFPLFGTIVNGYILGVVSFLSVQVGGFGVLFRLLPHGIFELPAVFISLGIGIRLGTFLFTKKKKDKLSEWFLDSLRVFLLVVFPLLLVAAFIEGLLIIFV